MRTAAEPVTTVAVEQVAPVTPAAPIDVETAELPRLAGLPTLDVESSLVLMGGNTELYVAVLKQFLVEYADFKLDQDAQEAPNRGQQLHTLKGLSGNLGAKRLQVLAMTLHQRDEAGLHPVFNQEMARVCEAIHAFLRQYR